MNKLGIAALAILAIATSALLIDRLLLSGTSHNRCLEVSGVRLKVEMAETDSQRVTGLSGRDMLSTDLGMLFVFDTEEVWSFWMKDMRFPLDIIWFSSDRRAVFIKENLPPCSSQSCPVHTPSAKAKYTLEVNAGFVAAHGITLGSSFTFLPVCPEAFFGSLADFILRDDQNLTLNRAVTFTPRGAKFSSSLL